MKMPVQSGVSILNTPGGSTQNQQCKTYEQHPIIVL